MRLDKIMRVSATEFLKKSEEHRAHLFDDGLIILTDMDNKIALEVAKSLGEVFQNKDADKEGIVHLSVLTEDKRGQNVRGFTSKELYPHTDRSVERFPPDLIILWCNYPASRGGESILADGQDICEQLLKTNPASFYKLTQADSAIFSSEGRQCITSILERASDNRCLIRFRNDELGFFCGDILDALVDFKKAVEDVSQVYKLKHGEGYIISNTRWLHGRTQIEGVRSLARIHVYLTTEDGTRKRGFLVHE